MRKDDKKIPVIDDRPITYEQAMDLVKQFEMEMYNPECEEDELKKKRETA
ncbi:MAG: hypothetical protein ACI3ZR_05825 [bacterium]